ncbi:serine/threonine-protein kinase LMTK1-like [Scyliorhinus canicula]|uniref:serine/threonine-protein kinase LMTK1-like n=1 Tax=Scyliorhinus canicula TaxID=7830 RepID=UPI0018F52805|nr:serine/threonine-protein kinase LMTK1-like [Scyliorhinus canicula]
MDRCEASAEELDPRGLVWRRGDQRAGPPNEEEADEEEEATEGRSVPIVVTESEDSANLRSLLKSPRSPDSVGDLEGKKKMVSFFDDVTVYLFDQETPTNTLCSGNLENQRSPQQQRGNDLLEPMPHIYGFGGSFEWDDDFPLTAPKAPFVATATQSSTALTPIGSCGGESDPQREGETSRFTISPAAQTRFSITHVSDPGAVSSSGDRED